jgi:hypothetical protein
MSHKTLERKTSATNFFRKKGNQPMPSLSHAEKTLDRVEAGLKRTARSLATAELIFRHDPGSAAMRIHVNRCRSRHEYWKQRQRAAVIDFVREPLRGSGR